MSLADYVRNEPTPESAGQMIKEAEQLASSLKANDFKMTQLRGVFGHVRRLHAMKDKQSIWKEFRLLEPRIHYRLERHIEHKGGKYNRGPIDAFKKETLVALREVGTNKEKFERFVEAFETIVAYMPRK